LPKKIFWPLKTGFKLFTKKTRGLQFYAVEFWFFCANMSIMCLWIIAYEASSDFPLVLAGNRDEFFKRRSRPAYFWPEYRLELLAGQDFSERGTWMGVTRKKRLALVTNIRDFKALKEKALSRGMLPLEFLGAEIGPEAFFARLLEKAQNYNPFNMVAGGPDGLFCLSSQTGKVEAISPGIHGLSNASLDTPWPKVFKGRAAMPGLLKGLTAGKEPDPEPFFQLLADTAPAPDNKLPDTGVGLEWERALSSIFVATPAYGTRCSTVYIVDSSGNAWFFERTFGPKGPDDIQLSLHFPL
jgi:uncharacterized protein with NRDE domain